MIEVIRALAFNNKHILYYHMSAKGSIGLGQSYFACPDYLVAHCLLHSTFFDPETINPTGLYVYGFSKILRV